jgi:hypothetical protein
MRSKRSLPKTLLSLGFFVLFLLIIFGGFIRKVFNFQLEKIKIYTDNFFAAGNLEVMKRPRPITTVKKETDLEVYLSSMFGTLTQEEWDGIWNIVYGLFPRGKPAQPGLPYKMRQLTQEEIISELTSQYPRYFSRFTKDHWKAFFEIILAR